jgi:DNA-binding NarL/FixJ family response regulator
VISVLLVDDHSLIRMGFRLVLEAETDIEVAGEAGFLLKDTQPAHLVAAIHTIAAGDAVLAPGATNRLVRQFATQPPEPSSSQRAAEIRQALTGREQEVFTHIATGQSNSEIAATLFLSEGTVKIHVGRILAKLGLRDRV